MARLPEDVGRTESLEIARRRKLRNWAILVVLVALCVMFYALTVVKFLNR